MKKVAIIGGGVLGMSFAYYASKSGIHVTLIEKSNELGGLANGFRIRGQPLEKYYHHLFGSDTEIAGLIREIGLGNELEWLKSSMGMYYKGKIYDFSTSISLIKFPIVNIFERLRAGLVSLYLQKVKNIEKFEKVTALDWCKKYYGKKFSEIIWKQLLLVKFGPEDYDKVSMAWLWARIHDRSSSRKGIFGHEYLGYPKKSFSSVINKLEEELVKQGVKIHKSTNVSRHKVNNGMHDLLLNGKKHTFTDVIVTTPPSVFLDLFKVPNAYKSQIQNIKFLGAVCFVLEVSESFSPYYWLNITDNKFPFLAVVEHTNFVDKRIFGGNKVLYIAKYIGENDPLYNLSESELLEKYIKYLKKINPDFDKSWIKSKYYFRTNFAQHIVPLGYKPAPYKTGVKGLYYANFSQIYPHDRGMNYAVMQAKELLKLLVK